MLEMSNGYPNSASPLGSPSPGPSPGIGGHHNKRKILTILKLTNLWDSSVHLYIISKGRKTKRSNSKKPLLVFVLLWE